MIDKKFNDWHKVKASFTDDIGDTLHRNHAGWGRIKAYTNNSGRNDIVEAKVAAGKSSLSFYVRTHQSLTNSNDSNWMNLYINNQDASMPLWQGFQFRISVYNYDNGTVQLQKSLGGFKWQSIATLKYAQNKNEVEIFIPKKSLGIEGNVFTIDFKWTDNIPSDGNPLNWLDKGDAAPNGRFAYRYIHHKN